MPQSSAHFMTQHGSRYLQQLCKHFGHKVPVTFTQTVGEIRLPFGHCALAASDKALTLTASSPAADLARVEKVMGDHLARFAFREAPTLKWQRAAQVQ